MIPTAPLRKSLALGRAICRRWGETVKWFLLDARATLVARYPRLATIDAEALLGDRATALRAWAARPSLALRLVLAGAAAAAAAVAGLAYLMVPVPAPVPAPRLAAVLAYDLAAVRTGEPVSPVFVEAAGTGLRDVADTARRKDLFIRLMLPLILRENRRILEDRKRIPRSPAAPREELYQRYGVEPGDVATLERRVDAVPPSLVLAQAAVESGWGTSRFSDEANNFFGHRTYKATDDGVAPDDADGSFRVRRFATIAASVRAYLHNLNTHRAYAGFRRARKRLRRDGGRPSGLALAVHLTAYSERRQAYVRSLERVIRRNHLEDFDSARLASR